MTAEHRRSGQKHRRTVAIGLTVALASAANGSLASAQTPIPPSASDFAMSEAQSDVYETMAAQDALTQSQRPQVRAFAQEMIKDHARMGDDMRRALLAAERKPPPAAMSSEQASMLAALQGLRGEPFDKAYVHQQILAHTQALAIQQSYATSGKDSHLQSAAQNAIPVIRRHLEMAEQLNTLVGGS